jgi:hypothetical protein
VVSTGLTSVNFANVVVPGSVETSTLHVPGCGSVRTNFVEEKPSAVDSAGKT